MQIKRTQVGAQHGFHVTLVDQNESILTKSMASIEKSLGRVAKKAIPDDHKGQEAFLKNALKHLSKSTSAAAAVAQADLVIEAVVENIGLKQKLFAELEAAAPKQCILASNTSSLRLADIGKTLKDKSRFGGLHFFNPVPMMKLLEVVRHAETSDQTFNRLTNWGKEMGKVTVSAKDTPGFIVNRLLVPYMMEAMRMAERGDASTKDIDTAMKLGAGYPMGPFELADYVGLDTNKFILDGWARDYPDNPLFKPIHLLDKLVKEGKLGRKSGEGFYKYEK